MFPQKNKVNEERGLGGGLELQTLSYLCPHTLQTTINSTVNNVLTTNCRTPITVGRTPRAGRNVPHNVSAHCRAKVMKRKKG